MNPSILQPRLQSSRRISPVAARRAWPPLPWFAAALLLMVLQLASGTGPVHALLVFVLLCVSYQAIAWAGGLSSLFGLCIFYLLLQHVLVSQIAKVFFWEPADTPLRQPIITMAVYIVGMAGLAAGAWLARRMTSRREKPWFEPETEPRRLLLSALLCTVFGVAINLAASTVGTDEKTGGAIQGGVLGPLKQLTFLYPLAVSYGTAYHLKVSRGRHSLGWVNGLPMLIVFLFSLVSAGRLGAVFSVIIYLATCFVYGYRFRPKHYLAAGAMAYIALFILFPYALFARGVTRTGNFEENVRRASELALDVIENPLKYHDQEARQDKKAKHGANFDYYTNSEATLSRYTILPVVDGVIDAAVSLGPTGMQTITPGFEMVLPRFLYDDKPFASTGNYLAHREPGLMPNKHDVTTGITVGFFADAFSSFGWIGTFFISCAIMFFLQAVYSRLIGGRIWQNPFVVSFLSIIWGFSESPIAGLILTILQGPVVIATGLSVLRLLVNLFDILVDRANQARQAQAAAPRLHRLNRRLLAARKAGDL